ncbi:MAG: hypothetical protein N3E45_07410 [Oscillatoriaceae bacterium SKW80]|nr:hypothetical protein [Oscillatoriaceae bacterium SKW80]
MSASLGGGCSEALVDGLPGSMIECILQVSYSTLTRGDFSPLYALF